MFKFSFYVFILLSFNSFAVEESSQSIIKNLNSCIEEVKETQRNHQKSRESKGPFYQLLNFVNSFKYDDISKTMIGIMEEVKFSLERDRSKIGDFKKVSQNLYSKKLLRNKDYFWQGCYSYENEEEIICEFKSDLSVEGIHQLIKKEPLTFCHYQWKGLGENNRILEIDDIDRHDDLLRWAQNSIDEATTRVKLIQDVNSLQK